MQFYKMFASIQMFLHDTYSSICCKRNVNKSRPRRVNLNKQYQRQTNGKCVRKSRGNVCSYFYQLALLVALKINLIGVCNGFGYCKVPIDIRDVQGIQMNTEHHGRAEYFPFPGGFSIVPGGTIYLEFNSLSQSGLIMMAVNLVTGDVASVQLIDGLLVFDRMCAFGRAHEATRHGSQTSVWHSIKYIHNSKGGKLLVNGHNPFRHYHLGHCANLTVIFFGALPVHLPATFAHQVKNSHQFNGCLRGMRIDDKIPAVHPKYHGVSQC